MTLSLHCFITPESMRHECDRTRLIAELASLLRECEMPDEARAAGLTLIGFLARRMPGEEASTVGVVEVTQQLELCTSFAIQSSSVPSSRRVKKPFAA